MLELVEARVAVVTCAADPVACDAVSTTDDRRTLRLAPDELMVLTSSELLARTLAAITEEATAIDARAIAFDATDGWTGWGLRGDATAAAFARLSALQLPNDGFVQGEVAGVPAKVVPVPDGIDVLVPSMFGAYLRDVILARCAGLGIAEAAP
jgi:sarcosine oxidase gamma subunit